MNTEPLLQSIIKVLDDNKGQDIKSLDIRKLTDVSDYIVICTATSQRHARALGDHLLRDLRNEKIKPLSVQGDRTKDDWVLVDFGDVVAHIMLAEAREFYSLEKLWGMTEKHRPPAE